MRFKFIVTFFFIIVVIFFSCNKNIKEYFIEIKPFQKSIFLDGILDSTSKSKKSKIRLITIGENSINNSNDLGANFVIKSDGKFLYVFIEVLDDIIANNEKSINDSIWKSWKSDAIELHFTSENSKHYRYDFIPSIDTIISINPIKDLEFKQCRTKLGYNFEILIPLKNLSINLDSISSVNFDIKIADNDVVLNEKGNVSWAQSKISWSEIDEINTGRLIFKK